MTGTVDDNIRQSPTRSAPFCVIPFASSQAPQQLLESAKTFVAAKFAKGVCNSFPVHARRCILDQQDQRALGNQARKRPLSPAVRQPKDASQESQRSCRDHRSCAHAKGEQPWIQASCRPHWTYAT